MGRTATVRTDTGQLKFNIWYRPSITYLRIMAKKVTKVSVVLRFTDPSIHTKLVKLAKADGRSLNSFINRALEEVAKARK
jgi:hypothetical protein